MSPDVLARFQQPTALEWADWRWHVRHGIRSRDALLEALGSRQALPAGDLDPSARFPAGVTPYYLSLVDPSDRDDPILKQILPVGEELERRGQEREDPFEEDRFSPVPGVVHRYPDRALIIPTNYCATLCRHCFRKRSWAEGFFRLDDRALSRAVEYVRSRPEVRDVIVTGGDPLHLRLDSLVRLLEGLRSVPHLEVLRIASRTPVTLPQRIDEEAASALARVRPLWFLTHFNHARELTPEAAVALRRLIDRGLTVQNQAVLLRGVNDSTEAQLLLSRGLLKLGVRPYYLHCADPVAGAGHFRLPVERALEIVRGLYGKISGLGIPRLVVDLPGGKGKVPLAPDFQTGRDGDRIWFLSPIDGGPVAYVNPS